MPNNCNSIIKTFVYTILISFIVSCASTDNNRSSAEYFGKLLISKNGDEQFSFNININLAKKDSIIQIKKPFYGNVLKIKVSENKNIVFLPDKGTSPFYVPEEINRNFKYWMRQCLLSNNLDVNNIIKDEMFSFSCKSFKNKTDFNITYQNIILKGFVIKK